jgi:hypothetical protein
VFTKHHSIPSIPHSLLTPICTLLLISGLAAAASPPPNTIPVIAMNAGQDSSCLLVTADLLCELSWRHFDGVWVLGHAGHTYIDDIMEWCDERDMLVVHATPRLGQYADPAFAWARLGKIDIGETNAFIHPSTDGEYIDSVFSAEEMTAHIDSFCTTLYTLSSGYDALWFWDIFNEGPHHQWAHMTRPEFPGPYDDFYPDVFTQDTLFNEVEPDGVFSWIRHRMGELAPEKPVSLTLGCFHWADWAGIEFPYGYLFQQANCVDALRDMTYQEYDEDGDTLLDPVANGIEFLDSNTYPFRQVGTVYQDTADWVPSLGDSLNTWILDHYEDGMDSTFIPAGELPIHLHTQVFGMCGGYGVWDTLPEPPYPDTVCYDSGIYRTPTPAEFLMESNLGLVRGAAGIFPYSLRSYDECNQEHYYAGLLDVDLIPFDAPYEEWVYKDRLTDDFHCIPPDSYPPFIDSPYDFDPLYDLPARPILVPGSQRNQEDYLLWKYAPYGRLWRSIRDALGQVAVVAPRISLLAWWDGHEDDALIEPPLPLPEIWTSPEIKVFTDSTESVCCIFYVNRQCRDDSSRYTISLDEGDFPNGTLTEFVLDHSRRFLIPVDEFHGIYSFQDTLEAGQGRLVEFVDPPLDADIRIAAPDVSALSPGTAIEVHDFSFTAGETVEIRAAFYNLGTEEAEEVIVSCTDLTAEEQLAADTLDFDGLSTDGWSCDSRRATFMWETRPGDIGVHVLEFRAEPVDGEADSLDNATRAVFLIEPRDYAATVLEDPWDMTEDGEDPPDWYTSDVIDLVGWETGGSLTDSISGMFEGTVTDPSETNRLYLRVGRNDPVPSDLFHMLSLAGIALDSTLSVHIGWRNEWDDEYIEDTGLEIGPEWDEVGPVDIGGLSLNWYAGDIEEIWLELRGAEVSTLVRLGWVHLTE